MRSSPARRCDAGRPAIPSPSSISPIPDALYVRGALPDPARAVAIVGARASTPYGRGRARELAADLARLGWSDRERPRARGIDAAAHEAALEGSQA